MYFLCFCSLVLNTYKFFVTITVTNEIITINTSCQCCITRDLYVKISAYYYNSIILFLSWTLFSLGYKIWVWQKLSMKVIWNICACRVHDVYSNRILEGLSSMQKVTLQALPTDEPWTVEEFLERTEDTCHSAAVVSHILWGMTCMALHTDCIICKCRGKWHRK